MNMKLATAAALAIGVSAIAGTTASAKSEKPDTRQVAICHFSGHDADASWLGGGTDLDGDYVLNYVVGVPTSVQIDYCEGYGGHVIMVSAVAAEKGHEAQLLERIAGYPTR